MLRVFKFGGTSVGNVNAFRRSAEVLQRNAATGSPCVRGVLRRPPLYLRTAPPLNPAPTPPHTPPPPPHSTVGVLSAMFGVTNRLFDCVRLATARDRAGFARVRNGLLDGHVRVARDLCGAAAADDACDYIHASFAATVDATCRDAMGAGALDAVGRDVVCSAGERWSTRIMAAYMGEAGRAPGAFVDSATVIATNGVAGNAKPLLAESRALCAAALRPLLAGGAIPLVTGFYGGGPDGRPATLGRGGSDLSAAVLGYCLDAAEIVLYKVESTARRDGWMGEWAPGWVGIVHCADPKTTVPRIHYDEARELCRFTKKVLHPDTVSPAIEKGIPINVRNSLDPAHAGTLIVADAAADASNCRPPPRATTVTRVALAEFEAKHPEQGELWPDTPVAGLEEGDAFLVAVVGLQVMHLPAVEERALGVLAAAGIPAVLPSRVNASPHNVAVLVPRARNDEAMALLHGHFCVGGEHPNLMGK